MPNDAQDRFSQLLKNANAGDKVAFDELYSFVYNDLRKIASAHLRFERYSIDLKSNDLVHEAYLRLAERVGYKWQSRHHLMAAASLAMRQILIDRARRNIAAKTAGGYRFIGLDEAAIDSDESEENFIDLIALDVALDKLSSFDERQHHVVLFRLFVGLTLKEIADVLELSLTTVKRDWQSARAWLYRELSNDFVPVQVHLSSDDPTQTELVSKSMNAVLESFGFSVAKEFPSEEGSWFKEWFAKAQESVSPVEVNDRFNKLERAIEKQILRKPQSDLNKEQAEAIGSLIDALNKNSTDAVIQIGSVVLIKRIGQDGKAITIAKTLTQRDKVLIDEDPNLLSDPQSILAALSGKEENYNQHSKKNLREKAPTCFISHSHQDEEFARKLRSDLQQNNIQCWFAPEDLKIGDKFRTTIDHSIQRYDRLLIVLSGHSVTSDWVEHEVEAALEKETEQEKVVLFPIRLDDEVLKSKAGWAAKIKRERNIGDFKNWQENESYQKAFKRLLRDLKEY